MGTRIQMVHATSGEVRTVYESQRGACCGVATWHPREPKVAFILGPEHPTADWSYGASRRQGVIVDTRTPGLATNLDARDLVPPFTAGALRGGTHVHVWSADGQRVSFTYEDQVLAANRDETAEVEVNLRGVGVADLVAGVSVPQTHPRNHNGSHFSVLVTELHANPQPGSDQIRKAFEEGWIDRRRLAFQGHVVTAKGDMISEVFVVELLMIFDDQANNRSPEPRRSGHVPHAVQRNVGSPTPRIANTLEFKARVTGFVLRRTVGRSAS